jgi:hypothetical protein
MTTVDNQSPPGAWADEIRAAPWRFKPLPSTHELLARVRAAGLTHEANELAREIEALRAQVQYLLTYVPKGGAEGEK